MLLGHTRQFALTLILRLQTHQFALLLRRHQLVGKVLAVDLSASMLRMVADEAARRGLHNLVTECASAETLTGADAAYDLALTRYSAHHWRDVPAGLAQMRRVLKPGGQAFFMDVVSPGAPLLDTWLQTFEVLRDPSHVRDASLAEWQSMLEVAGFAVRQVQTFRLRLEFASWIERMQTPPAQAAAIHSLQQCAPAEVSEYFGFEATGSFTVDTVLISAEAAKSAND